MQKKHMYSMMEKTVCVVFVILIFTGENDCHLSEKSSKNNVYDVNFVIMSK